MSRANYSIATGGGDGGGSGVAEEAMVAGTQEACGGARGEARGDVEARWRALLPRGGRCMSRWGAQLLVVSPKSVCQKSNKKSGECALVAWVSSA